MRRLKTLILTLVFLFVQVVSGIALNISPVTVEASDNGLAITPPMGWNSWNKYGGNINADLIMRMADYMVSSGMQAAGYEYINIDDCWMASSRDANGDLQADPIRFPAGSDGTPGIKVVADYVHSKGLKLGIYTSNGTRTCQGLPASEGYEEIDAKNYAAWGVDYVKEDFCYNVRTVSSAYAPDIDKIELTDGTNSTPYEAESAVLSGGARISGDKVGYIGNGDGYITFDNVSVNNAGEYTMKVYYYNGDTERHLYVSVNGGTGACYSLPSTGGWSTEGTFEDIKITLNQGINTIKLYNDEDNTAINQQISAEQYGKMYQAIKDSGRPMVLSICEWGSWQPWIWGPSVGNLWRTTGDISDNWSSMVSITDQNAMLAQYAGPGHWNDPDMLEVGNGGMTETEYRSHFSLWSIMAAPLIAGNDLSNMSDATKSILMNKDVIAVDQDSLGIQGSKIRDDGDHEIFVKPLSNGDVAVVLFNRGAASAKMSVTAQDLGLPVSEAYLVKDLWQHSDMGSTGTISANVPSHGVAMYRVSASTLDKVPASLDVSFSSDNLAEAGQTLKVTTTFANGGIKPVSNAKVSLQAPDGWTADTLASTAFDSIPVGETADVDWNITVPANAAVGSYNLETTISYMDGTTERQQQGSTSVTVLPKAASGTTYLSDINPYYSANGWGPVEKDLSNGESSANDGKTITLNGVTYKKGLGIHAQSEICYNIGGNYSEFTSTVGLDDEVGSNGSVTFEVWGDGRKLWSSDVLTGSSASVNVDVDISGVRILKLVVTNGGDNIDYDHGDWADAKITAYYDYSGLLEPVNKDGSSSFELGSTVPIKFQLKDSRGAYIYDETAKLYIAPVTDGVIGTEQEADSTAVSYGNAFRYDSTCNQYILNLNTNDLTAGIYQIRVELGDGTTYTVQIALK